ncbi:MAG: outer membrane beta-barrel protein [Pseudomonadota bacterium]
MKMKTQVYAFVALGVLLTGSAAYSAAGTAGQSSASMDASTPAVTSGKDAISWTGTWVGIGIGRGNSAYDIQTKFYNPQDNTNYFHNSFPDLGGQGFLATIEGGYDWQVAGKYVVGISLDLTKTSIKTDGGFGIGGVGPVPALSFDYQLKPSTQKTLALRFGYLTSPSTLIYGLAGATDTDFQADYSFTEFEYTSSAAYQVNIYGPTFGLGVETKLSAKTSMKLEYRYSDFGLYNLQHTQLNDTLTYDAGVSASSQSVRLVFGYRF